MKIVEKQAHAFKLGEKIMIECQVTGSRPRAQIRWFKDKLQLLEQSASSDNNGYLISDINTSVAALASGNQTQISYLTFVPQLSDNMKSLSCVATNPNIQSNSVEPLSDSLTMNVQCEYRVPVPLICFVTNTNLTDTSNRPAPAEAAAGLRHQGRYDARGQRCFHGVPAGL